LPLLSVVAVVAVVAVTVSPEVVVSTFGFSCLGGAGGGVYSPAGGAGAAATVMLKAFVTLPALFAALTVKLNVPLAVGVPEMVLPDKLKPPGRLPLPLTILQVIGVSPVAARAWLYAVPTVPPGREVVVILGAIGAAALTVTLMLIVRSTLFEFNTPDGSSTVPLTVKVRAAFDVAS
jgi:hypothetical protein